jgi:phosphoribosylformylglycinamidine synthase
MWQFARAVDGIAAACAAFETPITGGNVSFYNETSGMGVLPTPVIGMLGLIEKEELVTPAAFQSAGDVVLLIGAADVRLAGSEYLESTQASILGIPAPVDLEMEIRVQRFVAQSIRNGWLRSAHDCSEGGAIVAALESALLSRAGLGFDLDIAGKMPAHRALFGEGPSRIVASASIAHLGRLTEAAREAEVPVIPWGKVTEGQMRIMYNDQCLLSMQNREAFDVWDRALQRLISH